MLKYREYIENKTMSIVVGVWEMLFLVIRKWSLYVGIFFLKLIDSFSMIIYNRLNSYNWLCVLNLSGIKRESVSRYNIFEIKPKEDNEKKIVDTNITGKLVVGFWYTIK